MHPNQEFRVKGEIENLKSDTIYLKLIDEKNIRYDTLIATKGKIQYSTVLNGFTTINLGIKDSIKMKNSEYLKNKDKDLLLFAEPGDNLSLYGKVLNFSTDYKVKGSTINKEFSSIRKQKRHLIEQLAEEKIRILNQNQEQGQKVLKDVQGGHPAEETDFQSSEKYNYLNEEIRQIDAEYSIKHQNSYVYLYKLLQEKNIETLLKQYESLPEKLKEHYWGRLISNNISGNFDLIIGSDIPTIKATTISGDCIKTNELKGKYAVLYFWGTWCTWNENGFGKMRDCYEKYKPNVEFIGVACEENNSTVNVQEYLTQNVIPWNTIINSFGVDDLTTLFKIIEYPTKLIIDPSGALVGIYKGENNDFYEQVERFMKED